jgi:predicted amino acid-binding ACT domain protein
METAVPMIGFGFMDQTILLQAGNAIDCTFGVWLGLSTLSAAAFGAIISNMGSVVFGGVVERTAAALGLASANFSHVQKRLPIVARTGMYGNLGGICVGCVLGLVNLLFIDTEKARELKDENSGRSEMYQIDVTNDQRRDATIVTIKGPDRTGLLAAITNAFADAGVSLLEVDAHQSENIDNVEDVFVVQNREKKQISEDRLAKLVDRISGGLHRLTLDPSS